MYLNQNHINVSRANDPANAPGPSANTLNPVSVAQRLSGVDHTVVLSYGRAGVPPRPPHRQKEDSAPRRTKNTRKEFCARQQEALQSALDKASDWCARIGLTLSATKTAFMSITNRRGRRRLLQTPICLSLNGHTLTPVSTIRVLGVELDASGSANAWVRSARRKSANTLHLIRRISQKTGGACSRMARILVRSILQPRLVYQAQFQRLTLRDWDLLETANRDSMRAITCLPRMTPITTLQAEAQLNTIDEIVHQRRVARYPKESSCSCGGSSSSLLWFNAATA
ncbi:hypothetical protein HPB51_010176 [Rhipicephalus microplus]|uniref:Tick transposon n=1 Tax=Rhipicephalus microplus TaxID=6941 RepID=A0A9J6F1Q2_RHIMP|nr:hypothetical protein HPB51_010176 [Rhipicephalus microplus]